MFVHEQQDYPALEAQLIVECDPATIDALRLLISTGLAWSHDELTEHLVAMYRSAGSPDFEATRTNAIESLGLPIQWPGDVDTRFIIGLHVCVSQVAAKMAAAEWIDPACRGEEWAVHDTLDHAVASLELMPATYGADDPRRMETLMRALKDLDEETLFADHDYYYAFDPSTDGIEYIEGFRAAPVRTGTWFDQLPSSEGRPNPLVAPDPTLPSTG